MNRNQGYKIIKAIIFTDNKGFALGFSPIAESPYVTWACHDDKYGHRKYNSAHYGNNQETMEQELHVRVEEYKTQNKIEIKHIEAPKLYKYYSTQRPVGPGTFPKPFENEPDEIINYDCDQRIPIEGEPFSAWGHLVYTRPLTKDEMEDYELRPATNNPNNFQED